MTIDIFGCPVMELALSFLPIGGRNIMQGKKYFFINNDYNIKILNKKNSHLKILKVLIKNKIYFLYC